MSSIIPPTEEDFINALRQNDDNAMSRLYRMYYPMVEHFVVTNGGLPEEAKDIYQEAFIVLYENVQKPDFVLTCKVKTYLYSVCRRLWLKRFTYRTKFLGEVRDTSDFLFLDDDTVQAEETERQFVMMENALGKLGEPCKTILEDYYINDYSMVQIAQKMGYTNADNAKNQKYKCLMRLKKIVEGMTLSYNSE